MASEESLHRFDAIFLDTHTQERTAVPFFRLEPIVYQNWHMNKPVLTHIDFIARDFVSCFFCNHARHNQTISVQERCRVL